MSGLGQFLAALGLLTRLPVPRHDLPEGFAAGRLLAFFPLVGLLLGALLALAAGLLSRLPLDREHLLLPAALLLTLWAALTGGLHLDGWADCCDALLVPVAREKRFEILRDPRLGVFGVLGLVLLLLVKVSALRLLLSRGSAQELAPWLLLVATPALARYALVQAILGFPLARPEGMGAFFRQGAGRREWLLATLFALVALLLLPRGLGLGVLLAAAVATVAVARLAVARLGGLSGDVYGAVVEASETLILLTGGMLLLAAP